MKIKVLLADDHKIVREGLRSLFEKENDIAVIAEADDGREAVRLAGELSPDVILMDVSMPNMNGIEATRRITSDFPGIRILMLSMHADRRYVVEAFNAGAHGYFLKDAATKDLIDITRCVAREDCRIDPKMKGLLISDYPRPSTARGNAIGGPVLSSREREVLQLIAEGKNTKEIAFILNVSGKTVETHRQQIMKKLNIRSIATLTKYAIKEGLTSLE